MKIETIGTVPIHEDVYRVCWAADTSQCRPALILVVDNSGSMAGAAYNEVKATVKAFAEQSRAMALHDPLVVLYNYSARVVPIDSVQDTGAAGGTRFSAAFDAIRGVLRDPVVESATEVSIVFMTDGQDNDDSTPDIQTLSRALRAVPHPISVHTIAYTAAANVYFLQSLLDIGSCIGCFRYASGVQDLDVKFQELFGAFYAANEYRLRLWHSDGSTSYVTGRVMPENGEASVLVHSPIDIFHVKWEDPQQKGVTHSELKVCAGLTPEDLLDYVESLPLDIDHTETIDHVQKLLHAIDPMTPIMVNGTPMKLDKAQREMAFGRRMELQQRVDDAWKMAAAQKRGDPHARDWKDGARFALYKFSKARRQRAMDQRAVKNASLSTEIAAKLAEMHGLDKEVEPENTPDLFICDFSTRSMAEVMHEDPDDILGFCLNVTLPEHAVDSAQVRINAISPTVTTYSNFLMALKYNVDLKGWEDAHGGFQLSPIPMETKGFAGRARERVNAWLPLYGCEAHWKRVEAMLPLVLGQFFTLDPLGYTPAQVVSLFGILGFMCLHTEMTERMRNIRDDFARLCTHLRPNVIAYRKEDMAEAFASCPAKRRPAVLPDMGVLVGWWRTQQAPPSTIEIFRFYEEIRRRRIHNAFAGLPMETRTTMKCTLYGSRVPNANLVPLTDIADELPNAPIPPCPPCPIDPAYVDETVKEAVQHVLQKSAETYSTQVAKLFNCTEEPPFQFQRAMVVRALVDQEPEERDGEPEDILQKADAIFQREYELAWTQRVTRARAEYSAARLASIETPQEFARQMDITCPTRGGPVFDQLMGILTATGEGDILCGAHVVHAPIPCLYDKILFICRGVNGNPWIPSTSTRVAMKNVLGEGAFEQLRGKMRAMGATGHRYRESGAPNRHGNSNAHPSKWALEQGW